MRVAVLLLGVTGCLAAPDAAGDAGGGAGTDGGAIPGECPGNLVDNGSFEEGTVGWATNMATAELVEDAADGAFAVEVCADGEGLPYFSFDDEPDSVLDPAQGEQYEVEMWVRWVGGTRPKNVEAIVRQWDADGPHPSSEGIYPDGQWRRVTSSLTVESAEPDYVDAYAASMDPEVGTCFQLDAVCLRRVE